MALVDDCQEVLWKIVEQAEWAGTRAAAVEVPRIVIYAAAISHFAYHLYDIRHTFLQPPCLGKAALLVEHIHFGAKVELDLRQCLSHAVLRCNEYVGRVNVELLHTFLRQLRDGVEHLYRLDFVPPKYHAYHNLFVGQRHIHRVALHAERAAFGGDLVARIQRGHKCAQELVAPHVHAPGYVYHVLSELVGVAHAVKARYRRNHHDVAAAREQRSCRGQPQAIDFVVYHQVLFDILVRCRYVCLGLVVVVIRHEVMHRVFGEKRLELRVKLCGERLVVRQHQCGAFHCGNHVGHGERLSRAGHAQQHLVGGAVTHSLRKFAYGIWLVAGGLVVGM